MPAPHDGKDIRSVNSPTLGRRLALIINETNLARWWRSRISLVEQRGHASLDHGGEVWLYAVKRELSPPGTAATCPEAGVGRCQVARDAVVDVVDDASHNSRSSSDARRSVLFATDSSDRPDEYATTSTKRTGG